MSGFVLFLHFLGLMLGGAGGFAGAVIGRRAASLPPEQAAALRPLSPVFARISAAGVVLLWITGLILVWTEFNGIGSMPGLFWVKMAFVVILTAITIFIQMTHAEIRKGNVAAAARLPMLGPAAGASALLAVLFAAYAFG